MPRNFAPPLNGEAIRRARLCKFMTQAEVACHVSGQVAEHGIKFDRSGLSLIENGMVKRPHPKVVGALCSVLGLDPDTLYARAAAA